MKERTRFVRTVRFFYNEVKHIDERVNKEIKGLAEKGGTVISINNITFGLSPALLIYTIIYESEKEIPKEIAKDDK